MNSKDRFIRWPAVEERTGLSRNTARRLEKVGDFPERRQISGVGVAWLESEIQSWIDSRPPIRGQQIPLAFDPQPGLPQPASTNDNPSGGDNE